MLATLERETRVAKTLANLKPLLKEYIARIEKIGDQVLELRLAYHNLQHKLGSQGENWMRSELENLSATFSRIRPDAEDVDRRASGLIENAGLDEMDRWELLLRLAELESAIAITEIRLFGALPKI